MQRETFLRNPETQRSYKKKWNEKIRNEVFSHYSGKNVKCATCGFSDRRALSIDHICGKGSKHRKRIGKSIYEWLISKGFPQGFQVLCMNCQFIKRKENEEEGVSVAKRFKKPNHS